jgi:hypothetical protein
LGILVYIITGKHSACLFIRFILKEIKMSKPFVHHMVIDLFLQDGSILRHYYLGDMRELRAMLDETYHWQDCFYQDLETGNTGHMFNR